MKDQEVIMIANMRQQASSAIRSFGTSKDESPLPMTDPDTILAFKELESMMNPEIVIDFINDVGPQIMSVIVKHTDLLSDFQDAKELYPRNEEAWIAGIVNVGLHMFYLGMHSQEVKAEERALLAEDFKQILLKLSPSKSDDKDAREKTEE